MRLNALWWWIDRWRKSTAYIDMTLEEQGAYRNLLDEAQLRGGPLPNDERVLARACGDARAWKRVRPAVIKHFRLAGDGWRNDTLDEVLKESERRATNQERYRARRSHPDNKPDNKPDNAAITNPITPQSSGGHKPDNKPASPSPSPSPDKERTKKASTPATPERPPTSHLSKEPADDGNYRVILKLAHEVIETTAIADPTDGDLVEALKAACARNGIDYSAHRVIPKALEAAARVKLLIPVNGSQSRRSVATMAAELRTAKTPEEMGARLKALAEKTGRS